MTFKDYLFLANKINNKNQQINKIILLWFLNKELSWLYANYNNIPKFNFLNSYLNLINFFNNGYPLQYIIGYEWFLNNKFFIDNTVLIPRNETEELVKNVLFYSQKLFNNQNLKVLDLGTGSGIIAISLALDKPNWNIIASDISKDSLNIAKINNNNFNLKNIIFIESDIFLNLKNSKFHIIVSNPPYIDKKTKNNFRYEPELSLFANDNGLYFFKKIFKNCHLFLENSFLLALEFGYNQKSSLIILINKYFSKCHYKFIKDINNNWRMLFIWKI